MEAEWALKRGNALTEGREGGLLKGLLYGVTVMKGGALIAGGDYRPLHTVHDA